MRRELALFREGVLRNVYSVISSEMVSRALYTAHRSVDYINLGHVKEDSVLS